MNTHSVDRRRSPNFLTLLTVTLACFLTACGGGSGGSNAIAGAAASSGNSADGASSTPIPIPTQTPDPVRTLASLTAKDTPAQWPSNFKAVVVKRTDLATDAELAQTTNPPNAVFIQIWYLDQDQQRQPVAVLTLGALARKGSVLSLANVPKGVKALKSEVYTASGGVQKTLASKEIAA